MKLKDAPLSTRMVVSERMDNEMRWTVYERIEGEATFNPLPPGKPTPFIRALHHRTMQGMPGMKPRYDSHESGGIETQVDGRVEAVIEAELTNGPNHVHEPNVASALRREALRAAISDLECHVGTSVDVNLTDEAMDFVADRFLARLGL